MNQIEQLTEEYHQAQRDWIAGLIVKADLDRVKKDLTLARIQERSEKEK